MTERRRGHAPGSLTTKGLAQQTILPRVLVVLAAAGPLVVLGCSTTTTKEQAVVLEEPRTTAGLMVNEPTDDGLAEIQAALDRLRDPPVSPAVLASLSEPEKEGSNEAVEALSRAIAGSSFGDAVSPLIAVPEDAGRLLQLQRLSRFELGEVMAALSLRLRAESGYREAGPERTGLLPPPPDGVTSVEVLTKDGPDGSYTLFRLGSARYASQLPQLWAQAVVVDAQGRAVRSAELDAIQPGIDAAMAQVQQMRTELTNADLERQVLRLSYTNTGNAVNALKGMGVNTLPNIESIPPKIEFAQLPLVAPMPAPAEGSMALIGSKDIARGQFGVSVATNADPLPADVNVAPSSELMVLYHPAHPEQLSMVQALLQDFVDKPARMVFVEGMVLEISEEGLDKLGIEWEFKEGPINMILGSLDPSIVTETLDFDRLDSRDTPSDWGLRIQALVREGQAEVLSRPSVLTIDNRQASIRVGEDIPIATSQEGSVNSNKIAFSYSYIPTGILLNIRPRLSDKGDEVSMLVDTLVSAQVPGRDLEIRSAEGDLLASAPTISTRRVQTYARMANKTPFIIGGLVSRDRTVTTSKVPLLGDIPFLGEAFKSTRASSQKREVIIVLTPYVLPEENRLVSRTIPKDQDIFDNTGNQLFRDAYRIRAEDVFDLRFIAENRRLSLYRDLSREVISRNFRMAELPPFSDFAENDIPGEEMLVQRMIYELIKRTEVDNRINTDRMIYFDESQAEGYRVRFLSELLAKAVGGEDAAAFFTNNPGKALAITFTADRQSADVRRLASEPIPDISIIDCPDRDTWSRLLWDLNQPSDDGTQRNTILLKDDRDLVRLQRAMMMKQIILLNADDEALNLKSFRTGKIIHVPAIEDDKVTVIDSEVASYFYVSELYYSALIQRIESTLAELDRVLRDPEIQTYLSDPTKIPERGAP